MNPWDLSPRQLEACELLTRLGWIKLVADAMTLSIKSVEEHLRLARKKASVSNNVLLAVAYCKTYTQKG